MIKDSKGNDLIIGAMYCCMNVAHDAVNGEDYNRADGLVRYMGGDQFVDADSLEDCSPDFDSLALQVGPLLSRSVLLGLGVPAEAIDAHDEAAVERVAAVEARRMGD